MLRNDDIKPGYTYIKPVDVKPGDVKPGHTDTDPSCNRNDSKPSCSRSDSDDSMDVDRWIAVKNKKKGRKG